MISFLRRVYLVAAALALGAMMVWTPGCKSDHSHDGDEQGHAAHGSPEGSNDKLPALSVTIWNEKTELFMEYEPLISGRASRVAAHLTTMSDFKAVTSGVLTLSIQLEDGTSLQARADGPSSPGIFRFNVSPKKAGQCKMSLAYAGQGIHDTIQAGASTVHATEQAARAAAPEDGEGGVAYTKEQQWKTDFATVAVGKRRLQPSIRAVGEIKPVSGREARITAPTRGRVALATPTPMPGMAVKKGQLLATLSPYLAAGGDRSTLSCRPGAFFS